MKEAYELLMPKDLDKSVETNPEIETCNSGRLTGVLN